MGEMAIAQQVRYESQVRSRYGTISFIAALTLIGSQLLQLTGSHSPVNELTMDLLAAKQRVTLDIVGAVLDLIGLVALAVTLGWLHNVTHYRRPEVKAITRWLAVGGAGLTAVMSITYTIMIAVKADQFSSSGNLSFPEAQALTSGGLLTVVPLLLELGTFMLAFGCIWVSLNALRAGLLTRFVGYAGIIAGALFMFPIGSLVPLVQGYWLGGMAVILANRWPNGDPPAWEAGEAIPWTPLQKSDDRSQQQRQRKQRSGGGGGGGGGRAAVNGAPKQKRPTLLGALRGQGFTPPPEEKPVTPAPGPRAGTPKRKRKRRS